MACPPLVAIKVSSPNDTRPLDQPITVRCLTSITGDANLDFQKHPLPRPCRDTDLVIEWHGVGPHGPTIIVKHPDLWGVMAPWQGAGTYTATAIVTQKSTGKVFSASHSWVVPWPPAK